MLIIKLMLVHEANPIILHKSSFMKDLLPNQRDIYQKRQYIIDFTMNYMIFIFL